MCDLNISVTNDDYGIATCGLFTLEVVSGPMEAHLTSTIYVTVPGGSTVKITETSSGTFTIINQAGTSSLVVHADGNETQVGPGEELAVTIGFPWIMFMPAITGMQP